MTEYDLRTAGRRLVEERLSGRIPAGVSLGKVAALVEESAYVPLTRRGAEHTIDYGGQRRSVALPALPEELKESYHHRLEEQAARVARLAHRLAGDLALLRTVEREGLTMVSRLRLLALLLRCREAPAGAFVECGVARGGCLAVMLHVAGGRRGVWGFDSFEGMPELGDADRGEGRAWVGYRCGPDGGVDEVRSRLADAVATVEGLTLAAGWVEDTLQKHAEAIGDIAVLRLDVDWYGPTLHCLEALYERVVPGGAVVVDDYGAFAGCRDAVDLFRANRGITAALVWEDHDGVEWTAG